MVENHTIYNDYLIQTLIAIIINHAAYRIYIITPNDQISQLLSYFSGPSTSGAKNYINTSILNFMNSLLLIITFVYGLWVDNTHTTV